MSQFCILKLCADYSALLDMERQSCDFLAVMCEKMTIKCVTGETNISKHMREELIILKHELNGSIEIAISRFGLCFIYCPTSVGISLLGALYPRLILIGVGSTNRTYVVIVRASGTLRLTLVVENFPVALCGVILARADALRLVSLPCHMQAPQIIPRQVA
ncbi:hypothetical protein DK66_3026 [Brucella suis 1330]|nr:hypothetical protein DK66_3026 [Brucella suis 1330]